MEYVKIEDTEILFINKNGSHIAQLQFVVARNNLYIQHIDVEEGYRNYGIGTRLMKKVLAIAKTRNVRKVKLDCMNTAIPEDHNLFCKFGLKFVNKGLPEMVLRIV